MTSEQLVDETQPASRLASRIWDVLVVGAGPAGSSAAIMAARAGLSVLLVDAKRFPRRKVCGGCLNRVSTGLLRELLGAEHPLWEQTQRLDRFLLTHRRRHFSFGMPEGRAIDRAVLDQTLVATAQQAGVVFRPLTTAKLLACQSATRHVELSGEAQPIQAAARAVVLASGLGGRSQGIQAELQQTPQPGSRVGIEAILERFPAHYTDGAIHMVVANQGYVGLTQISGQRLHVAAAVNRTDLQRLGPAALAANILREAGAVEIPELAHAAWRGTPPLTCRAPRLASERVFLVGDAAGYVEPFTGEGIRWALQTGMGVVPQLVRCQTTWQASFEKDWEDWYRQAIEPEQRLCRRLAHGLKQTPMRWIAHQALRLGPGLASKIIARLNQES